MQREQSRNKIYAFTPQETQLAYYSIEYQRNYFLQFRELLESGQKPNTFFTGNEIAKNRSLLIERTCEIINTANTILVQLEGEK